MNFSDVLKAMNQASAFELFRMRAAINRVLDQPQWAEAIRSRLHVGQLIEYFDSQGNTSCKAKHRMNRKRALASATASMLDYAAINIDGERQIEHRAARPQRGGLGEIVGYLATTQRSGGSSDQRR